MQKHGCKTITRKQDWFDTVFERPYTSLSQLVILWSSLTLIDVKFTPVIGFGFKVVRIDFFGKIDVIMMMVNKKNSKAVNCKFCALQI